jgi:hypothetical protein
LRGRTQCMSTPHQGHQHHNTKPWHPIQTKPGHITTPQIKQTAVFDAAAQNRPVSSVFPMDPSIITIIIGNLSNPIHFFISLRIIATQGRSVSGQVRDELSAFSPV